MLKKEEVYLNLGNSEEIKEIASILKDAKEDVYNMTELEQGLDGDYETVHCSGGGQWTRCFEDSKTLITIQQLRDMLNVKKFKVGDRVRILSVPDDFNTISFTKCIGKVGELTDVFSSDVLIIDDNEWEVNFRPENLELVTEAIPTQTVTRKDLAEIYSNVCSDWQNRIDIILSTNRFGDDFEVSNNLVDLAYREENSNNHLAWLNKHLPKPKKVVTKEVVGYINVYDDDRFGGIYLTAADALLNVSDKAIKAAVKFTGTYQIEE